MSDDMQSKLERLHGPDPFDTAPGKEFIKRMAADQTAESVERFYRVRRAWCGGSYLVSWGPGSRSPFHDVNPAIDADAARALLPHALALAEREPWQTFACAICLVETVFAKHPLEGVAGLGDALLRMIPSAIAAGLLGAGDPWRWLTDAARPFLVSAGEEGVLARLPQGQALPSWWTVLPVPSLRTDPEPLADCDADSTRIGALAQESAICGVRCVFSSAWLHRDVQWWVWRCEPHDPSWVWLPHVFYRRAADGSTEYTRQHFTMPRQSHGFRLSEIGDHIARYEAEVERGRIVMEAE